MKNAINVVKRYKATDAEICCCCGRKIMNVELLATGDKVGSECSGLIEHPVYRIGRKLTAKQAAYFEQNGLTMPERRAA